MYRQFWYFTSSLQKGSPEGLFQLYGYSHKNLYTAGESEPELYDAWAPWMNMLTRDVEDAMLRKLNYPHAAKVLDCAGETGLGVVKLLQANEHKQLQATTL